MRMEIKKKSVDGYAKQSTPYHNFLRQVDTD